MPQACWLGPRISEMDRRMRDPGTTARHNSGPRLRTLRSVAASDKPVMGELKGKEHALLLPGSYLLPPGSSRSHTTADVSTLSFFCCQGIRRQDPQVCHQREVAGRTSFLRLWLGRTSPNHFCKFSLRFLYTGAQSPSRFPLLTVACCRNLLRPTLPQPTLGSLPIPVPPPLLSLLGSWQDRPDQFRCLREAA